MTSSLPAIYLHSKQSEFRKKLASAAIPPTEREMKRAEFSRMAYGQLDKVRHMERKLLLDMSEYFRVFVELGGDIEKRMSEDPFYQDMLSEMGPFSDPKELERSWLSAFEKHGFLFFPNKGLNCGLLLSTREGLGEKNYITALMENNSVQGSVRVDGVGFNIIDAARMVEDAVFKINTFRFAELEPIASLLLSDGEVSGHYEVARNAFRRRLMMLFDRSGRPDRDGIGKVIEEIAPERSEIGFGMAGAKVSVISWSSLSIQRDNSEDELLHTVNYLNSLVANAFISYGLGGILRNSGESGRQLLRSPMSVPLSTLAGIAFGEPYDKLAAIVSANLSGRPDHMLSQYLIRMSYAMGYQRGQGQKRANQFMLTRNEALIRKAALGLLNEELGELIGRRVNDEEAGAFAEAGSMKIISGEDFQRILGVWAQKQTQLP
jgi:hypothetical protein